MKGLSPAIKREIAREVAAQFGKLPPKPGSNPRGRPKKKYKFAFGKNGGYVNGGQDGGTIYDLIETREETKAICDILNEGIGPDWDAVEPELVKRGVIHGR